MKVFVLSKSGVWVQHGPVRASVTQAESVARLLARRLGWVCVAALAAPAVPVPLPKGCPSDAQAGCSPVWKDPVLAATWASAPRGRVVVPPAPSAPPAKVVRVRKPRVAKVAVPVEAAPATV